MALTDLKIRNIRPTDKVTQFTDDRGLYVEVHPNGSKLWRYKYRYMGKQKRLALGRYPDVGLAEARKRRDEARSKLDAGADPLAERKREKLVAAFSAANSFAEIAREYIDKRVAEGQSEATTQKANWLLEQLKPIWTFPVADIKPVDLLAALKRIEAQGKHETARRCRSFAGRVFRYAVATGRGETDPSSILRGALIVPKVKHHAAILDPGQMGELLRAIDAYTGHAITRLAMQVSPHAMAWRVADGGMVGIRTRQRGLENPRRAYEDAPPSPSPAVPAGTGISERAFCSHWSRRFCFSGLPYLEAANEQEHRQSGVPPNGLRSGRSDGARVADHRVDVSERKRQMVTGRD